MLFIKKKAKDAEIIAAKAAEEAKAAEGIQEAPKVELVKQSTFVMSAVLTSELRPRTE